MGLYDRDYAREEPRGIQLGGDWSAVTTIIVINVAIYIFDLITAKNGLSWLQQYGSLQGNLFERPWQFYQLFTYGWLHDTENSLVHITFNMLTLFFFGPHVERLLITKTRFWQFYLGSMVFAGLGWVIAQQPWFPHTPKALPAEFAFCIGASGAITAVFVYSVLRDPHRTLLYSMIFPLPAWVVGLLSIGTDVARMISAPQFGNIAYACHLAGALSGFLMYKFDWCLGDLLPLGGFSRVWKRVNGPRVRLHRPSVDHDEESADWEEDMTSRVDEILAKISATGEASLTKEERRILQNASRQLRQRQGK